jgi:hypothetical protein
LRASFPQRQRRWKMRSDEPPRNAKFAHAAGHPLFFPLFFVFGSSRTLLHITVYTRHRFSHLPACGASSSFFCARVIFFMAATPPFFQKKVIALSRDHATCVFRF